MPTIVVVAQATLAAWWSPQSWRPPRPRSRRPTPPPPPRYPRDGPARARPARGRTDGGTPARSGAAHRSPRPSCVGRTGGTARPPARRTSPRRSETARRRASRPHPRPPTSPGGTRWARGPDEAPARPSPRRYHGYAWAPPYGPTPTGDSGLDRFELRDRLVGGDVHAVDFLAVLLDQRDQLLLRALRVPTALTRDFVLHAATSFGDRY